MPTVAFSGQARRVLLSTVLLAGACGAAPVIESPVVDLSPIGEIDAGAHRSQPFQSGLVIRPTFPEGQCTHHSTRDVDFEGFRMVTHHHCDNAKDQDAVFAFDGMPLRQGCELRKAELKSVPVLNEGAASDHTVSANAVKADRWSENYVPPKPDPMLHELESLPEGLKPPDTDGDDDAIALQAALRKMAKPERATLGKSTFLIHPAEMGLGMTIDMMVLPVLQAFVHGHTLWAPKLTLWATEEYCGNTPDWSCHFDSLASPIGQHAARGDAGEMVLANPYPGSNQEPVVQKVWDEILDVVYHRDLFVSSKEPFLEMSRRGTEERSFALTSQDHGEFQKSENATVSKVHAICDRYGVEKPTLLKKWWFLQQDETDILSKVPHRYLKRGRGWLISQVIRFLVEPGPRLREQLAIEKKRLGIAKGGDLEKERFVAIHVRKGDACMERGGANCFGLKELMPQIERFLAYNITTIYVASPDDSVFDETKLRPDITWLHRERAADAKESDHAAKGVGLEVALYTGMIDAAVELNRFMVDTYIMADATGLIGSFESSVPRLIHSIATSVYGCIKPFKSITHNWFFSPYFLGALEFTPFYEDVKASKIVDGKDFEEVFTLVSGDRGDSGLIRYGRPLRVPIDCLPHDWLLDNKAFSASQLRGFKASVACSKSVSDTAVHRLQNRIARVQGPEGCKSAQHMTLTLFDAGWGSTVHGVIKPIMHAVSTGTLLHTPTTLGWTNCSTRGLGCMFQDFAPSCEEGKYEVAGAQPNSTHYQVVPVDDYQKLTEMTYFQNYPGADIWLQYNYSYMKNGERIIPEEFRSQGWFWYSSQLLGWAFRPDQRLRALIDEGMDVTGLGETLSREQVLGLHVRQGDACGSDAGRTGRQCDGLDKYMVQVEKMRNDTGVRVIFLQTDSDEVRRSAPRLYPQYSWLMWHGANQHDAKVFKEHGTDSWDAIMQLNIANDNTMENEETARLASVSSMLLSKCDMFVGKFSSNIFRLAYELKAADCNCAVPFASLDASWCFDYAMVAGKSEFLDSSGNLVRTSFPC